MSAPSHSVSRNRTGLEIGRYRRWIATSFGADASTRENAKGPHSAKCDVIMEQKPELQKAFKDIIAFFGHLEEKALGPEAVTPTYYISHLGTLPDYQRKGLAGALLNMAKQKAKSEGKTLTLLTMTEPNVSDATEERGSLTDAGQVLREVWLQEPLLRGGHAQRYPDAMVGHGCRPQGQLDSFSLLDILDFRDIFTAYLAPLSIAFARCSVISAVPDHRDRQVRVRLPKHEHACSVATCRSHEICMKGG